MIASEAVYEPSAEQNSTPWSHATITSNKTSKRDRSEWRNMEPEEQAPQGTCILYTDAATNDRGENAAFMVLTHTDRQPAWTEIQNRQLNFLLQ